MVTEKSIAYLISYNGCGKKVYNVKSDAKRDANVPSTIFKEGNKFDDGKGPSTKDLTDNLRVWFKIILGCIHHRPNTNSSNYINTTQKCMLFFLEKCIKMTLLEILFRFLIDLIRENIIGSSSKKGKFISNGRLISYILVENGIVEDLLVNGIAAELVKDVGKVLWGNNMKNMGLISKVVKPDHLPSKEDVCGTRFPVANFPIFTKVDPLDVLAYYLASCIEEGTYILVDPFNLPYAHVKRKKMNKKKDARGEGTSEP